MSSKSLWLILTLLKIEPELIGFLPFIASLTSFAIISFNSSLVNVICSIVSSCYDICTVFCTFCSKKYLPTFVGGISNNSQIRFISHCVNKFFPCNL
ncbi:hypothetical protein [Staphylococcus phage phiBU01]|uniref:Uncharacterized protein n=1 Tax=Staphylococcus phage phiBU01 TaxID=1519999 RepID=A0A075M056_9CAUD|nr:hypothetical protein SF20_gp41 [Staphylococcus phage phiBU01]AIF71752.1 hypothetical protein [Staphylococcus phage phiBU01]